MRKEYKHRRLNANEREVEKKQQIKMMKKGRRKGETEEAKKIKDKSVHITNQHIP